MVEIHRTELAGPPDLAARFVHVRGLPWGDGKLAFELLVPKEFEAVTELEPRTTRPAEFLKIGSFRGPIFADSHDTIDVAVTRLPHDVSLADFFDFLREQHGLEVIGLDPLEYGDREAVDALTRWCPPAGRPRISRFVLFRNGAYIARVSGTALGERYEPLAEPFAVTLSTFKFLDRRPDAFTEPFEWLASRGAIPLGFRRPLSWRAAERTDVPWGRQVIELTAIGQGAVEAYLRVKALDRDVVPDIDLESLARETAEELRGAGFEAKALVQRFKPRPPGGLFEQETLELVFEGRAFGAAAEARAVCLRTSRAFYAVGAISPAKEADRIAWMGARRVLEVVLMSLNRPEENILKPPGLLSMKPAEPPPPAEERDALDDEADDEADHAGSGADDEE
jgi:hypothetical protein